MARDLRKMLKNMPESLAAFYHKHIDTVKEGIGQYFPPSVDKAFFEKVSGQVSLYEQDWAAVYDSVLHPSQEYLDRGGKVLRPILVAMTLEAYGVDPSEYAQFMGAIEVMEDSSIMMDDYIDNSELRRGGPCGHVAHGFPIANISACTAFALAHYLFYNNEMALPRRKATRLLNAFAWEHIQMAYGQIEELYWTESNVNTVTMSAYLQETIARCAFLSFRGPLRYAAIIADAPEEDIPVLARIGEYLLIGYHIRGDILDMQPDSDEWGKIAGEDITTGRRTLLINYVLQKADREDREKLEGILNARTTDDEIKHWVFDKVVRYGGFEYTRELARQYDRKTREQIALLHIPEGYRKLFREFSDFAAVKRSV